MLNTQTNYLGESARIRSARRTEVLYQELIARMNMNLTKQIPAPKSWHYPKKISREWRRLFPVSRMLGQGGPFPPFY